MSHAWDVHEAPASACFKFRVGTMELLYTLRGVDDAELQRCQQIIRDWTLRESRMSVDEQGRPLR